MSGWTDVVLSHMYPWPIGVLIAASVVSLIFGAIGVWSLWRVRRLLAVVPIVQERVDTLSNSVTLLTDTTESCFKALSMQLQFVQAQGGLSAAATPGRARASQSGDPSGDAAARKGRQRRVVGAAGRGEGAAAIAAREDVAESEVALRLHLDRDRASKTEAQRHGSLHS